MDSGAMLLAAFRAAGGGGAGMSWTAEVGVSRGLPFTGHEVSGRMRPFISGSEWGFLLLAGYRVYAGRDHWKSFADLDLVVPLSPGPAAGLRLGLGLMYDVDRGLGLSLAGGAFGSAGSAFVTGFDLSAGVHIRFD